MNYEEFASLEDALEGAQYICAIEREDLDDQDSLLTYLEGQPSPYYNYILCVLDDDLEVWPFYTGYTADLSCRLHTHASRVEFDILFLFHGASKETALHNELSLMDLLGTRELLNGSLTQMPHVSRTQILEAIEAQARPVDKVRKYAEADVERRTYYMNPTLLEALRTYAYDHHTDVSETLRICLVTGIPEGYLEAAYAKVLTPRQVTA